LLRDPRVPRRAKLAIGLVVPYLAMPFDLVPDFIPVAGQLDDAILGAARIAYVARAVGSGVIEELSPGLRTGPPRRAARLHNSFEVQGEGPEPCVSPGPFFRLRFCVF
jgi:uncharacterized membrane protein YkvA (DUF1232 family)